MALDCNNYHAVDEWVQILAKILERSCLLIMNVGDNYFSMVDNSILFKSCQDSFLNVLELCGILI